jgi:hypothetical protein
MLVQKTARKKWIATGDWRVFRANFKGEGYIIYMKLTFYSSYKEKNL